MVSPRRNTHARAFPQVVLHATKQNSLPKEARINIQARGVFTLHASPRCILSPSPREEFLGRPLSRFDKFATRYQGGTRVQEGILMGRNWTSTTGGGRLSGSLHLLLRFLSGFLLFQQIKRFLAL